MSNKEYNEYKLITTSSYLKYIKHIEIQIVGKIYNDLVLNIHFHQSLVAVKVFRTLLIKVVMLLFLLYRLQ